MASHEPAGRGRLYVVATPIGNLQDWTRRASSLLEVVDLILCEDTRWTTKLLTHYGIRTPTSSYHDFSESRRVPKIIERLLSGSDVALVTDAGTPTVSDPGYRLILACREQRIPVIPIPGPSAAIAALSVSGLPTDQFHFAGFLPPRQLQRRRAIEAFRDIRTTIVLFEAPRRLRATLEDLRELLGDRTVFIGREMTKVHETYLFGRITEVLEEVTEKGEAVIVLEGQTAGREKASESVDLSVLSRQELLKLAARRLGVSRKELWDALYRK